MKEIPLDRRGSSPVRQRYRNVTLRGNVDGEFTTLEDVATTALLFATFPSNALTGQSLVVSHGWYME